MPETKACIECGASIPATARLCQHCSSYQDRRRYLGFSQTTLALLVALVSVVGATAPLLIKAFSSKRSVLSGAFVDFRRNRIAFYLSNDGSAPGIAVGGQLAFDVGFPPSVTFNLSLDADDQTIIEPSKTELVAITGEGAQTNNVKAAWESKTTDQCTIRLLAKNFDGSRFVLEHEARCMVIIDSLFVEKSDYILGRDQLPEPEGAPAQP